MKSSVELILIVTMLLVGHITGWAILRDTVLAELADIAAVVGSAKQSSAYSGVSYAGGAGSGAGSTSGVNFTDATDAWDVGAATQGIGNSGPSVGLAIVAVSIDQSAAAE